MTDHHATTDHASNTNITHDDSMLNELQKTETLTRSLREQLARARKDNVNLEADLVTRASALKATLDKLQTAVKSGAPPLDSVLQTQDAEKLRQEALKLHEFSALQEKRVKKLEFDLDMERGHANILRAENLSLRRKTVDMGAQTEQEEEFISNTLLKRIYGLKKEKSELLIQVEQEEEYLTNMLQRKLTQLQKEKIDLENALEQEQEYIVNRLQKQLDALRLAQPPSSGSVPVSPALVGTTPLGGLSPSITGKKWLGHAPSPSTSDVTSGQVELFKAELTTLKARAVEMQKEYINKYQQCTKYRNELLHLRKESQLPAEDLLTEESLPPVYRSVPPSPGHHVRANRSTSTSSQRSLHAAIPPLQLDQSTSSSTQYSDAKASNYMPPSPSHPDDGRRSRSTSVSSSSGSASVRRDSRRISGNLFGLQSSTAPQHPPQF